MPKGGICLYTEGQIRQIGGKGLVLVTPGRELHPYMSYMGMCCKVWFSSRFV